MRATTPRTRFLAATTIVAATIALSFQIAAPASAAAPTISVRQLDVTVAPGNDTTQQDTQAAVYVTVPGLTVKHAVLTFDATHLPAGASLSIPDGWNGQWQCTTAGEIATCDSTQTYVSEPVDPRTNEIDLDFVFFTIAAASDAPFGSGSMLATVSADGLTSSSTTIGVNVAQPVSFSGDATSPSLSLAPGATYTADPMITNTGTTTIHGIDAVLDSDYGFNAVTRPSNCFYDADSASGYCHFDADLAPGVTYDLATPMKFQISADHQAPFTGETGINWFTPGDAYGYSGGLVAGTGSTLGLEVKSSGDPAPVATDTSTLQTFPLGQAGLDTQITVTGHNAPTYVALGATLHGLAAPDTTTISVGAHNTGPAAGALNRSGDPLLLIDVTAPVGTTVTTLPNDYCAPYVNGSVDSNKIGVVGYAKYRCVVQQDLAVNADFLMDFGLKLTKVQPTYTGVVDVYDAGDEPNSERKLLSSAKIVIDSAAVASPSPSSTTSPSTPPTAGPSPTPSAGGATPSPSATATTGSGLPLTGTQAGLYGAIGGVLLALGIVLILVGRKRRNAHSAV
jgi:LPXTG-motif cell wall-anchored protein